MNYTKIITLIVFFIVAITVNTNILLANPKLSDFLRQNGDYIYSSKEIDRFEARMYLAGLTHGIEWMNHYLRTVYGDKKRLYCPPENVALNVDNYLGILEDLYAKNHKDGEYPIGLILTMNMWKYFPCN